MVFEVDEKKVPKQLTYISMSITIVVLKSKIFTGTNPKYTSFHKEQEKRYRRYAAVRRNTKTWMEIKRKNHANLSFNPIFSFGSRNSTHLSVLNVLYLLCYSVSFMRPRACSWAQIRCAGGRKHKLIILINRKK